MKPWKQALSYNFVTSSIKKDRLAVTLKEVARWISAIGLTPLATMCDIGSSNAGAIHELLDQTRKEAIKRGEDNRAIVIGGIDIIPLFDAPHKLKCARNNLLEKNATFKLNGTTFKASWSHIETAFRERWLVETKVTVEDVYENKMKKMNVTSAAKVCSKSVSQLIKAHAIPGRPYNIYWDAWSSGIIIMSLLPSLLAKYM